MSIVSSPASFVPASHVEAVCIGCSTAILISAAFDASPLCTSCKRSHAEHEARRLLADAKDLASGAGVFADVPADERREQVRALIFATDVNPEPAPYGPEKALRDLIDVLPDSSIVLVADLVARKIADRNRKPGSVKPATLVRVAIADLSDAALIEIVGTVDDPIILNAASAELANRLANQSDAYQMPLFNGTAADAPDAATRDELEGKLPLVPAPVYSPDPDEHPLAGNEWAA